MIILVFLGFTNVGLAQRAVTAYPKNDTVVRTAHKPKVIIYKATTNHFSAGFGMPAERVPIRFVLHQTG